MCLKNQRLQDFYYYCSLIHGPECYEIFLAALISTLFISCLGHSPQLVFWPEKPDPQVLAEGANSNCPFGTAAQPDRHVQYWLMLLIQFWE